MNEDFLLEQVLDRIGDGSPALASFARVYLQRLPYDAGMAPEPAYSEVISLFDFIRSRGPRIDVRVFDPDEATHGYSSPGTVVEVHVDDTPFLVDSITAELLANEIEVVRVLHPVIGVERDATGELIAVTRPGESEFRESVQHYVLDRQLDESERRHIERRIRTVVEDVLAAVADFEEMVAVTTKMAEAAARAAGHYSDEEIQEAIAFLEWLTQDNFVFLGYREYRIVPVDGEPGLVVEPDSGLGILSDPSTSRAAEPVPLSSLPEEVQARYREGDLLVLSKTNRLSTVHHRARMDYVGVRLLSDDGRTIGELRLLGHLTSRAHMESVTRIPILRRKLAAVAESDDLVEGSHDQKAVVTLVETFPKDELFGLPIEDLRKVVLGLLALQERARVRLFVRRDLLDRGVRILVALPRERFTAELRRRLQDLFVERFGGSDADHHLSLDRSDLARLHFTVWVEGPAAPEVDFEALEAEVLELTRSWNERVADEILARGGERALVDKWARRLPDYYKASTAPVIAAGDISNLERLEASGRAALVALQNERSGPDVLTRITLYSRGGKRPLSELAPALENMGLTVVEEVPTRVAGEDELFMHDFGVLDADGHMLDVADCGDRVAAAIEAVWAGGAETDALDALVLSAGLDHRQVEVIRAYQTYWRRVSPVFTLNYVKDALASHPRVTAGLARLFALRFDPDQDGTEYADERDALLELLDEVPSLDEDRILRGLLRLIDATVRTNAYHPHRRALALKLRSADVPDVPDPRPHVETFVISPEVEGIHLRAGLRARGGIRWSERKEDYRTEVLGLMKAQVTKNAVIVPTGAKGGFVVRRPGTATPEEVQDAYEDYIRALLDVTDDLVDGEVVRPDWVRAHDGDDSYLVVAADRGTARLSDTANRIAAEYGFWLDDAFASGGATGYDHKGLGITARGAWKSLERHFFELGIDPNRDSFTAVGIGDMSGDVFGNGMLQSRSIRLVAAFDHRHIFLDPDPDPERAYEERRRLFELPGSSWDDYDRSAISAGGGVYPRSAKKIELSEEARRVLDVEAVTVTPAELIQMVLQAPVDLIWNGGIGTYVKASDETHEEVGDRSNDAVRVDGTDLRARVVVEGGNLGLTHRARIEYARKGGLVNADFIDNSAGVHCSDREVNLKILLRLAEERGEIDRPGRDELLAESAEAVVAAILADNLAQAHRLALDEAESAQRIDAYEQLIADLETRGYLDRDEDGLPDSGEMDRRARERIGLTRPELAVVLAHSKRALADDIAASHLPDSPEMLEDVRAYFPPGVIERFGHLVDEHPLRRELTATVAANALINSQGPTFVARLVRRQGVTAAEVVSAYRTARYVAGPEVRSEMESQFGKVAPEVWREAIVSDSRLVGTLTRWFLRRGSLASCEIEAMADGLRILEEHALEWGSLHRRAERRARYERLRSAGLPSELALRTAVSDELVHAPDIYEVAEAAHRSLTDVASVFHRFGRSAGLDELERLAATSALADHWQRWALQTLEDDLLRARRALAEAALALSESESAESAVERFLASRGDELRRVHELIDSLAAVSVEDVSPLVVALRQVERLVSPTGISP